MFLEKANDILKSSKIGFIFKIQGFIYLYLNHENKEYKYYIPCIKKSFEKLNELTNNKFGAIETIGKDDDYHIWAIEEAEKSLHSLYQEVTVMLLAIKLKKAKG